DVGKDRGGRGRLLPRQPHGERVPDRPRGPLPGHHRLRRGDGHCGGQDQAADGDVVSRQRLDLALEARGLMPSRARARDAILRGTVRVNGAAATKPGQLVAEIDNIEVADPAAGYVSRAALKLIAGLDAAGISLHGKVCLDVGASTGGFTQVLLERGAAKVYAVDVGHGQLDGRVAADPRVVALEGTNARDLTAGAIAEAVQVLTSDVSFVSVT